jgi:hypothetical protein
MSARGTRTPIPSPCRTRGWERTTATCLGALAVLLGWAGPAAAGPSTTTGSPSEPAPSALAVATSGNWSGYVATGTSYTEASATFDVPNVSRYVAGSTASEWVGVGGWSNSTLVQAGVNEIPLGDRATLFEPWWEVVPGPQELATGMMVRAGDSVSAQVEEVSAGRWLISLVDHTNGDSFSTVQPYAGPTSSAEWVVEADATASGASTRLAPLGGKVTFTHTALNEAPASPKGTLQVGTEPGAANSPTEDGLSHPTTFTEVVMVQGGNAVSTPSPLARGAFSVTYGGATR